MRDFYTTSEAMPLDQADGLRRLFAGARQRYLPLVSNPHVPFAGLAVERLGAALAARGHRVLIVDASESAPAPHELTRLDLAFGIEPVDERIDHLAARGLPLAYVDTRGSATALLDALSNAAPQAEVVLVHAGASDLARVFQRRAARPVVLGADHPESIKHAYASIKLLSLRASMMTFDLLLAATASSPRLPQIAASLAGCADNFLGCVLREWAVVDPALATEAGTDASLDRLAAAQLALEAMAPAVRPRSGAASFPTN